MQRRRYLEHLYFVLGLMTVRPYAIGEVLRRCSRDSLYRPLRAADSGHSEMAKHPQQLSSRANAIAREITEASSAIRCGNALVEADAD